MTRKKSWSRPSNTLLLRLLSTSTVVPWLNSSRNLSTGLANAAYKPVKLFYNDIYEVDMPPNHRFPMAKYRMVRTLLQQEYQEQTDFVSFQPSPLATIQELSTTHCPLYVNRYLSGNMTDIEIRRTGFPWSEKHVKRSTSSVGGTVAAMRTVLSSPTSLFAGHIAGGTHHAFYNYGEGFCIFSDIAVACNLALLEYPDLVQRVVIIDLDVHQGNGNAALFSDKPNICTFSMHCKENYFSARQKSSIDVELDAGTTDEEYLAKLKIYLPYLLDVIKPQLVFFQAGVDIFEHDKLGKLKISREGIQRRNKLIFDSLLRRKIKCVVTMGGGYPKDLEPTSAAFQSIIQCHADVYRNCIDRMKMGTY